MHIVILTSVYLHCKMTQLSGFKSIFKLFIRKAIILNWSIVAIFNTIIQAYTPTVRNEEKEKETQSIRNNIKNERTVCLTLRHLVKLSLSRWFPSNKFLVKSKWSLPALFCVFFFFLKKWFSCKIECFKI